MESLAKIINQTTKNQVESELVNLQEAIENLEEKESLNLSITHKIEVVKGDKIELVSGLSFVKERIRIKAKVVLDPKQLDLFK